MRGVLLAVAAGVLSLTIVASGLAQPLTTNEPAMFSVKVILTDRSITLSPDHAARGSYVTFIITNRGRKTHVFQIGDVKRGPGYGEGFARTLKPNEQRRIPMYLDYRGKLAYVNRSGKTTVASGSFRIS